MTALEKLWRSFRHARHGLYQAVAMENSFRIHLAVAVVVILVLVGLHVKPVESAIIIFLISTILTMELINTVVERFADLLEPRIHPYVGMIKDLLAAAVLITSVASVIIAVLVLWPYLHTIIRVF